MANDPSRTEKATPRRRQKAREEGSVPRSPDFDAALLLWGNFFLFLGLGGATLALMAKQVAHFLQLARPGALAGLPSVRDSRTEPGGRQRAASSPFVPGERAGIRGPLPPFRSP